MEYESLNKRLEEEVGRLSEEVNHYKIQVEEFSKQLLDSSNSQNSMEPLDLRKKVDSVELKRLIKKDEAEGDQFLTSCLLKIVTLENNVNEIQSEIDHNNLYHRNAQLPDRQHRGKTHPAGRPPASCLLTKGITAERTRQHPKAQCTPR